MPVALAFMLVIWFVAQLANTALLYFLIDTLDVRLEAIRAEIRRATSSAPLERMK